MYLRRRILRRVKTSKIYVSPSSPDDPLLFVISGCVRRFSLTSNYFYANVSSVSESDKVGIAKVTPQSSEGRKLCFRRCASNSKYGHNSESENSPETKQNLAQSLAKKIVINVVSSEKSYQHNTVNRIEKHYLGPKNHWKPDWRIVKELLVQSTPTHGPRLERAVRFTIPHTSIQRFLCSADEFIFDIGDQYDCNIELTGPEKPGVYSKFILSGSELAIDKTIARLKELEPNITVERSEQPKSLIRYVINQIPRPIRPAHLVTPPISWTAMSLLEYVEDITAYDPNYHELRSLPFSSSEPITTHYYVVVMKLTRDLLAEPLTQQHFSRAAFHRLMKYFSKKCRTDFNKELFLSFECLKIKSNPETFNIMLWTSAELGDFHNFHFILQIMLEAGLTPNGRTWVALLRAAPSREVRFHIYEKMKEKGLLSYNRTLQNAVAQLIEFDLQTSLFKNQTLDQFINTISERYGSKWLSIEAANRVLSTLGRFCLISRTFEFLEYMESNFVYPDSYTINTILYSITLRPKPWIALVELMRSSKFRVFVKPERETCRILFRLAWEIRTFNMARILWKYACLTASTSVGIRKQVIRSLLRGKSLSPDSKGFNLRCALGFFILGPLSKPHPMELPGASTLSSLDQPESSNTSYSRRGTAIPKDVSKRIDLDLKIFEKWRPVEPFSSMLWRAIKLDVEWQENQTLHKESVAWIVDNSEAIPIYPKSGGHGFKWWN